MKRLSFLLLLGFILSVSLFGQLNYPEIPKDDLEDFEYTIIFEEPNGTYKIVVVGDVTYIVYY
ncbi:MAG: hypothetical protein K9N09_02830 [Candidatus Cloacimonetes bacterium]|nr:hypothetical protein [Candidatus Cloacimonadota bacterium]MCF7813163.1 hypothetical protein [Candidatus Cloacimonadota bacterium]MCF7867611.1 hypothetical protein [Candidatus Cloacimonadota bacterium]MCF7883114.1 hypothetical protein [Candidatus Cloacimonadota bacterium]